MTRTYQGGANSLTRVARLLVVTFAALAVLLSSGANASADDATASPVVRVTVVQTVAVAVTDDGLLVRANVPWQLTYVDQTGNTRLLTGAETAGGNIALPAGSHGVTVVPN